MEFFTMSHALPALAGQVMRDGLETGSRGGTRTMELLYPQVTLLQPWRREILTPARRASLPAQIAETMWVLAGRNDIGWLSNYLPRAADFSDDGETWRGGYGPRLRRYGPKQLDQLSHVVRLLKDDPTTRRAVIGIYDAELDSRDGKDIPCNDFITFQNRLGQLHMGVTIRSNDLIWGLSGINAFEWSALQEIVARLIGVVPGPLHFFPSSLHIYDRHWDRALRLADTVPSPSLQDSPRFELVNLSQLDTWIQEWFRLEALIRTGSAWVKDNIVHFPDPMMQSWLQVIQWYWTRDEIFLEPLRGTNLYHAALNSPIGTRS